MKAKSILFAVLCGLLTTLAAHAADKPNILVIMADDVGWMNVSSYGGDIMGVQTPNIDRIGREGLRLTSYYAQPSCTAGRAAFLTGQLPVRTGLHAALVAAFTLTAAAQQVAASPATTDDTFLAEPVAAKKNLEPAIVRPAQEKAADPAFPDTSYTPFRGAKGSSYEGGVRVPGIAYWKGVIKPGRVSAGLFDLTDLYATSLALAGASDKVPGDRYIDRH